MCRIIMANGYQTSAIDVDQDFHEVQKRIEQSKNGFVYLSQSGSGRYFSFSIIGYVVEDPKPLVNLDPATETGAPESSDSGVLSTPQTPIGVMDQPSIQQ